ncbi:26S proteasome non-ATPase regulatory subunit 9 [Porphyridium purpureum]|uniref:26S proteasome non-ATPase regulatory subunit 9 n=1 Tax=Porphyridium purpureum TaxID=35688 RepID=A0A5J4YSS3_PORPP|nr:26S proteasome non-ATPase regulatory subunit 9 [Porphyridium purpureum]|eukprot:POR9112..scf229_5
MRRRDFVCVFVCAYVCVCVWVGWLVEIMGKEIGVEGGDDVSGSAAESAQARALRLHARREEIEAEIKSIVDALCAPGMAGLTAPLVDAEGFPRADVDVMQSRRLRHTLACLRTDVAQVTSQMEVAILAAFQEMNSEARVRGEHQGPAGAASDDLSDMTSSPNSVVSSGATPNAQTLHEHPHAREARRTVQPGVRTSELNGSIPGSESDSDSDISVIPKTPFAKVNQVTALSPAHTAGLKPQDLVLSFGPIRAEHGGAVQDAFRRLPAVVRENVGAALTVEVQRSESTESALQHVSLVLVPQVWSGPGLLGCHLSPLYDLRYSFACGGGRYARTRERVVCV